MRWKKTPGTGSRMGRTWAKRSGRTRATATKWSGRTPGAFSAAPTAAGSTPTCWRRMAWTWARSRMRSGCRPMSTTSPAATSGAPSTPTIGARTGHERVRPKRCPARELRVEGGRRPRQPPLPVQPAELERAVVGPRAQAGEVDLRRVLGDRPLAVPLQPDPPEAGGGDPQILPHGRHRLRHLRWGRRGEALHGLGVEALPRLQVGGDLPRRERRLAVEKDPAGAGGAGDDRHDHADDDRPPPQDSHRSSS